jgi:hypothetical protein
MKVIVDDLWNVYENLVAPVYSRAIIIPTNGTIRTDGACVMGAGLALDAKKRWPNLPHQLGEKLKLAGNVPHGFPQYRVITFPVKHNWWEKADLNLIQQSAMYLATGSHASRYEIIYIPKVGCGNGRLQWKDVKHVLEKYLTSRFIIVTSK